MKRIMHRYHDEQLRHAAAEIEVKVLEIDRPTVEERLDALGARKVFDGQIHALYYDLPDRRLKTEGITLRLRMEGPKAVLTLKEDVVNAAAKERREFETEIRDFKVMRKMLETLGFSVWLEMKKHRTSYELPTAHVEIDRYEGDFGFIPEFLEIEGRNISSVYLVAEALGFQKQDCKPWDAVELASFYRERNRFPKRSYENGH